MTPSGYIHSVPGLVRRNARFFLSAALAGSGLRLLFVFRFPAIVDDSRLYADIAVNWLRNGIFGITNSGHIMPTLSRLPGYPAFLAAVFTVFGVNNFRAVLLIQVLFDLATCFLIADLARRMLGERAAKAAFLLAVLCPFLANYAAAALTESLEIFFTALALDLAVYGFVLFRGNEVPGENTGYAVWFGTGLAVSGAILLRPDGGILLAAIVIYLGFLFAGSLAGKKSQALPGFRRETRIAAATLILLTGALAPLVPWTLRNLSTFHRFQPLAPRYANDSDEPVMPGFNRWTKTWIADYVSVEEIYWNVPGDSINFNQLPSRAFDSPQQKERTAALFGEYNQDHDMTPELDERFGALAAERIRHAPLRYYVWLPLVRIADMWLRPRTELLPSDPRWWEFNDAAPWLTVSLVFGAMNLACVAAAAAGTLHARYGQGFGLLLFFVLLRSAFLGTLENPEPRYTLECYPVVILWAAALFLQRSNREDRKPA